MVKYSKRKKYSKRLRNKKRGKKYSKRVKKYSKRYKKRNSYSKNNMKGGSLAGLMGVATVGAAALHNSSLCDCKGYHSGDKEREIINSELSEIIKDNEWPGELKPMREYSQKKLEGKDMKKVDFIFSEALELKTHLYEYVFSRDINDVRDKIQWENLIDDAKEKLIDLIVSITIQEDKKCKGCLHSSKWTSYGWPTPGCSKVNGCCYGRFSFQGGFANKTLTEVGENKYFCRGCKESKDQIEDAMA